MLCFKGSGATWPGPNELCAVDSFDTNDDLLRLLREAAKGHDVGAIFHVAALCDYKVKFAEDERGERCNSPKIASRSGCLTIRLEPATKSSLKCGLFRGKTKAYALVIKTRLEAVFADLSDELRRHKACGLRKTFNTSLETDHCGPCSLVE